MSEDERNISFHSVFKSAVVVLLFFDIDNPLQHNKQHYSLIPVGRSAVMLHK